MAQTGGISPTVSKLVSSAKTNYFRADNSSRRLSQLQAVCLLVFIHRLITKRTNKSVLQGISFYRNCDASSVGEWNMKFRFLF